MRAGAGFAHGYFTLALLTLALAAGAAGAQESSAVGCGRQAAQFAGGGNFSLWVTRRGVLTRDNPLRPLSPEVLEVLQVVIRGKAATAYGPDPDNLRRGPAPASLESQSGGAPIRWGETADGLPATLRIRADDSTAVLAELRFRACGDAPKVAEPKRPAAKTAGTEGEPGAEKPAKPRPQAKPQGKPQPKPEPTHTPGGFVLPQGAIP
ncbi:hypothetical protein [Methylobacterium oryzisoli]|uniref:hypothetical protein n=1 Tax=Methylobacterium oryzisoli TaxID=3385502 RepID=UPI003892000E